MPQWPDIHIPTLIGEPIFYITPDLSITNAHITMWLVMAVLIGGAWLLTRDLRLVPGGGQNFLELIVQGMADFIQSLAGPGAVRFLHIFGTLFIFIFTMNMLGILPLEGQIRVLHSPTADYHVTFAMAATSFVIYQFLGIRKNGLGYFGRFINFSGFKEGPLIGVIMVFVGFIELFSETFRMLTLTLRLWGNVIGGHIALGVMSALLVLPGLTLPFYGLEVLIGTVQALIFAVLVIVYIDFALASHEEHEPHEAAHPETAKEVAHA